MVFVYDPDEKKIHNVAQDKLTKDHKVLPNNVLMKIATKNIYRSMKAIGNSREYFHISMNPLVLQFDDTASVETWQETTKSIYYNPTGLWFGVGTSWLEYVQKVIKKPSVWNLFNYIYKINISSTVLVIRNLEEFYKFINKYKHSNKIIKMYNIIDWKKVTDDYDGLVIDPYLGDKIWKLHDDIMTIHGSDTVHDFFVDLLGNKWKKNKMLLAEWYRHWEVASGVVWHNNGISNYELYKENKFAIK